MSPQSYAETYFTVNGSNIAIQDTEKGMQSTMVIDVYKLNVIIIFSSNRQSHLSVQ